jgi:hypothetical protein
MAPSSHSLAICKFVKCLQSLKHSDSRTYHTTCSWHLLLFCASPRMQLVEGSSPSRAQANVVVPHPLRDDLVPESIVLTRGAYLRYEDERAALSGLVSSQLMLKTVCLSVSCTVQDDICGYCVLCIELPARCTVSCVAIPCLVLWIAVVCVCECACVCVCMCMAGAADSSLPPHRSCSWDSPSRTTISTAASTLGASPRPR